MSRQDPRFPWPLALALLALVLFQLGAVPLFDVDEGAFSEATREMLASGDWGHTTLNGEDRFDKPILVYWLQAASVSLLGLHEFALRLPSALCAWGWALAVWAFARPRLGERAATSAALMMATSLGVLAIGRAATADALLNFLLVLAAFDAWRWLESEQKAPLRRAFAWMGLGLLAKGPVAVLVPVAAAGVWLLATFDWRYIVRRVRQAVSDWRAWVLLIGIAAPWYTYALHRHGQAFIDGFFVRHNLSRYTGTMEQHGGGWAYYLVVMPLLLLPWAPLLAAVARRAVEHWQRPLGRFLLGWGVFVIVFFSLSGTKLPHYVLYGATPLVLLMAVEAERMGAAMRWALAIACLALLALVTLPAISVPIWVDQVRHPMYRALLAGAEPPVVLAAMAVLVAVAVVVLARASGPWRERLPGAGPAMLSGGMVALVVLGFGLPWWGMLLQGPVRDAAVFARIRPEPAVQWQLHQPSFAVYRGQPTPRRAPQPGELALIRVDHLKKLPADAGHWETVFEQRGIALVLWHGPAK